MALDNLEYMLDLAANGRFAMLNIPFPINRMITYFRQTLRTAVDSKINTGKVLVLLNFEAFLNTKIAGISINDFVIFSNQIYSFGNIMLVCRRTTS